MKQEEWARDIWVLCLTTALSIANFLVFGLIHDPGWKDAADYSAYAKNLLLGNGYSLDGIHFSLYREPGVPAYLIPIYKLLGIETPTALFAAYFIQAILLGFLGFLFYKILRKYDRTWLPIALGAFVSSQPILGDHTNAIGTEMLFTFFLGVVFYVCLNIMRDPIRTDWRWFAALGLVSGYQTLVRMQFLLFLPFITCCFLAYLRFAKIPISRTIVRNTALALLIFAVLPLSFATYAYKNTGIFAVTQGRDGEMLYYRAARAELSYGDITRYLRDWIWRSVSGGVNTQHLTDNEFKKLGYEYELKATTSEATARVRAENIQTILNRPGHYLYGNIVEVVKLFYIEHDYSDTLNRYFRPAQYLILYIFTAFGIYQLIFSKKNWDVRGVGFLSLLFIIYNAGVLSFLNVVPRFNTPYLPFFILIGFLGILILERKQKASGLK